MKKYPKYKDSGVEWIGDIPEGWEITRFKYILNIQSGKGITNENFVENGNYEILGGNGVLGLTNNFSHDGIYIVIGRVGALCGNVRLINGKKWISDNALVANTSQNYQFVEVCLKVVDLNKLANKNAQPLITGTMVKEQYLALPPIEEQTVIANYLDRKIEEINTLITNKEKLIELLKEERTAIINHAIDSNDFKEISIRYLVMSGQLEHQDGNHGEIHPIASEYVDSGIPFIMANHIVNSRIDYNNCKFISKERASKLRIGFAKEFDVLLTHKGTIGRVGIVKNSKTDFVILTPQVTYYRCKQNINYEYLSLVFQSDYFQTQLAEKASNGTTREYVGLLAQRDLKVRLPHSIEDQIRIANKLNKELETNGLIISKTEKEIELLNEYKAALISEVVTGKVDVREEVIV